VKLSRDDLWDLTRDFLTESTNETVVITSDDVAPLVAVASIDPVELLGAYVGSLRALQLWFHAAHNLAKGVGFSGDHVDLFGKIYVELQDDFDATVEKVIGITQDESTGCPVRITGDAYRVLEQYSSPANLSAIDIVKTGLNMLQDHVTLLTELFHTLEDAGILPLGLNDFLMSSANTYDTYVYLLQQRAKEKLN